jgi:hypothetical protein
MSPTVTKAKRIIARMDKDELKEMSRYVAERVNLAYRREREAKEFAQYERIIALPIDSPIVVNAVGHGKWPRGTRLTFEGVDKRARKYPLRLKTDAGKAWHFSRSAVHDYDLIPEAEFDGSKMFNVMRVNF